MDTGSKIPDYGVGAFTGRMKISHSLTGLVDLHGGRVDKIVPRKAVNVMKTSYPYRKPTQVGG
jgi:hypothetical protein